MVKRYRRRDVIEAIQFVPDPVGLHQAERFTGNALNSYQTQLSLYRGRFPIITSNGTAYAEDGDYIIKASNGECYPCKPDIFAKTYESVD